MSDYTNEYNIPAASEVPSFELFCASCRRPTLMLSKCFKIPSTSFVEQNIPSHCPHTFCYWCINDGGQCYLCFETTGKGPKMYELEKKVGDPNLVFKQLL